MSKGMAQGIHQRDLAATARPAIRCSLTLVSESVALEVGFILHLYIISIAT